MIAGFDLHSLSAGYHDKKKGKDPCVEKPDAECQHCKVLTPEQLAQLSTPSYKLKNQPTRQLLSPLTNLLCLQLPTHRLLSFSLTDLRLWTDQKPLIGLPLVSLVPFSRPEGTPAVSQTQTVLYPTDPLLIFLWRRVNCQMNWMPPSPTLTSLSLRSNLTVKP